MKELRKSRREFIKKSSSVVLTSAMGFNILSAKPHSSKYLNADTLKVGLIGCGGRGTGAALQASLADPNVMITAMADIFPDKLYKSYENLKIENPDKLMVDEDHKFIGFDSYIKVLATVVDVVILSTRQISARDI